MLPGTTFFKANLEKKVIFLSQDQDAEDFQGFASAQQPKRFLDAHLEEPRGRGEDRSQALRKRVTKTYRKIIFKEKKGNAVPSREMDTGPGLLMGL